MGWDGIGADDEFSNDIEHLEYTNHLKEEHGTGEWSCMKAECNRSARME